MRTRTLKEMINEYSPEFLEVSTDYNTLEYVKDDFENLKYNNLLGQVVKWYSYCGEKLVVKMKVCMLVKVINSNCDYEPYFKVIGIGDTKVFNSFFEAEKFIEERGYLYNYREQLVEEL